MKKTKVKFILETRSIRVGFERETIKKPDNNPKPLLSYTKKGNLLDMKV